jgi:hypothetical protein
VNPLIHALWQNNPDFLRPVTVSTQSTFESSTKVVALKRTRATQENRTPDLLFTRELFVPQKVEFANEKLVAKGPQINHPNKCKEEEKRHENDAYQDGSICQAISTHVAI